MTTQTLSPRTRRFLSADAMFKTLRNRFDQIEDSRRATSITHSLSDVLSAALAMFSLKDPSLLAFQDRVDDPTLKNIFGIKSIPSDSQMRDMLDPIEFEQLNEAFADIFIGQSDLTADGDIKSMFSWVTDQVVTRENVELIARGGRCRWRIENETFNTLKNQGYHFEHNYGHGEKNLSTVLMLLMMLAFLIDQVQQTCCPLFQAVLAKVKRRKTLWFRLRCAVESYIFSSYRDVLDAILTDRCRRRALPPLCLVMNWRVRQYELATVARLGGE